MAKKVFIIGVNTFGLQYSKKDAMLMAECLKKYDYEIIAPKGSKKDIISEFENMLDNCNQTDTVLVYFSGHALIENGELQFIIDEPANKLSNKINLNSMVRTFESCKRVSHKLVILDCCNAGTSNAKWHSDFLNKYYILTSSGRIEQTRELDELEAGFLTYHMHQSLMNPMSEFIDDGNKIRVLNFYNWLKKQSEKHNGIKDSIKIPIPNLFGNAIANFDIGTVAEDEIILEKDVMEHSQSKKAPIFSTTKEPKRDRYLQKNLIMFILLFIGILLLIGIGVWLLNSANNTPLNKEDNTHLSLGYDFLKSGSIKLADKEFDKARRKSPKDSEPLYWKARVAFSRNNKNISLKYLDKALHLSPNHIESIALKVKLLILIGGKKRNFAKQFANKNFAKSAMLDIWLSCLNTNQIYSELIITNSELDYQCSPFWD